MYILGINISHHCSICLIKDGEIIFFLEEERISRIKHHHLPFLIKDEWNRSSRPEGNLNEIEKNIRLKSILLLSEYTRNIDHIIFSSFGYMTDEFAKNMFLEQIRKNFQIGQVHFYPEHHLYHACSAFYNSGFSKSLAIVLDGGGFYHQGEDFSHFREAESVYSMDYSGIHSIFQHYFNYTEYTPITTRITDTGKKHFSNSLSCGGFFNVISSMIGFDGTNAGKTMGLAAYGRAEKIDDSWFSQDEESGIWVADIREISKLFRRRFQTPEDLTVFLQHSTGKSVIPEETRADLAKKCQIETLEHTARLIDRYTKLTGERNVVLSGGYFLNCSNNYEYIKRFPDLNFFVDPVAHDGGTAIGAAKYLWHKLTGDNALRKLETLYLG